MRVMARNGFLLVYVGVRLFILNGMFGNVKVAE